MAFRKPMIHLTDVFQDEQHRKDWQFLSRDETDDEAIMRRILRDARESQLKYRACAQTALYPLVLHLGLGTKESVVQASALCGGFGGTEICGALVGGIAALGLEFGRKDFTELGGPRTKGQSNFTFTQARLEELKQRFKKCAGHDTINCAEFQEAHFGKQLAPRGVKREDTVLERIKSGELYSMWSTFAAELVTLAAQLAAEIILRERRKKGIATPLLNTF